MLVVELYDDEEGPVCVVSSDVADVIEVVIMELSRALLEIT